MHRAFARAVVWGLPLALASSALAGGCLPGGGPNFFDGEEPPDTTGLDGDGGLSQRSDVDLGDPFALEGLSPSHGPHTGGTRATLNGRGFSSRLRVFVGDVEVPAASILASSPTRAAIVTPPGPPGLVDVRIRDEATAQERVLVGGFSYDAFIVTPDSGATSGGTRIRLEGSGTGWASGTTVAIGGVPCTAVEVVSPTTIECLTPPGTPGAKDVTVSTVGGGSAQARDAFTYSDSPDGYRGGLSGSVFSGRMRVIAIDSYTGIPLPDAFAIVGGDLATAKVQKTTAAGVTEIGDLTGTAATVTVAARCHQPITFVDVPVDTVTAYLDPVLDPACAVGDPPSTGGGGGGRFGGVVEGQLVFPGRGEFEKADWTSVPAARTPTERRAAYVFEASGSPGGAFVLPSAAEAITPESAGDLGYGFSLVTYPGNVTLYVVAGLEDRSATPPRFTPYAMGVARGVNVPAQTRVVGVDVKMDVLFDHRVTVAPVPPAPGPRGPDRLATQVAVTLGASGFAILPGGSQTTLLPATGNTVFSYVPSLDNGLAGEQYVLSGIAATGASMQIPASVVSRIRTANANDPIALGGFLGVPVLAEPGVGAWGGRHVTFDGAEGPTDLTVLNVTSGSGLVTWTIVAPGKRRAFDVPDLAALPGPDAVGLRRGAISSTLYTARIDGFDYGRVRYGQLSSGAWNAWSADARDGAY